MIGRKRTSSIMEMMRDLNAVPKAKNVLFPSSPVHFIPGRDGCWAMCPIKGYGCWHPTLQMAVAMYQVVIVGFRIVESKPTWIGKPETRPLPQLILDLEEKIIE